MTGQQARHRALIAATWIGWLALLVSIAIPPDLFAFNLGRLGIAVGPTGSIVLALQHVKLPVMQVFEAGRQCGRSEAASGPERPRLRVVDGD